MASSIEEGRYRLLVDAITDYAIYMIDPQGVVTSWNAGAQRIKGYAAEEIIGEHFSKFYIEEDRAGGQPELALRRAAAEGRFEREGWRVRKDGSRFWAHVVVDAIRDDDGKLLGFAKIARDLTLSRAAEKALRRSEEQFRLLVQGVTDYAVFMLDTKGYVANWNAGAQRIKGYLPDEIIGKHFSTFYTEEERAAGIPDLGLETARREGRWEREGPRVRKDGVQFWAHVVIDAIRDEQGEVIGFAKVTRDVTERRAAQQALEEAREALYQSQKLEAIGHLTGGVAHDFNNLLMAVLGSLELLKKRLRDPDLLPLLDTAIEGAERGATLTQRMLAFARRQELKFEAVELPALTQGMAGFLRRTIGPRVSVELDFPGALPPVRTDPGQLETALLNLVVNARDAMPEGGAVTITAEHETVSETRRGPAPGEYVRLVVADNGEGMDEDTLDKATEPFFTTKGVGRGTGLGLSMAQGLAAQSGGDLVIASRKGVGTTVTLRFPVAREAVQGQERASPAVERPLEARLVRVLVVDDDRLVLANTAALLVDLGHRVATASGGREALERLSADPVAFDLVITDQVMPQMTGLQLRDEIAGLEPSPPVLIMTGFAELPPPADRDFQRLSKPFTQAELSAAIGRVLSRPVRADDHGDARMMH